MPESLGPETRKGIGHIAFGTGRHDGGPVLIESVEEFKGWFKEVLIDFPLGDKIENRKKSKRFVRCLVTC